MVSSFCRELSTHDHSKSTQNHAPLNHSRTSCSICCRFLPCNTRPSRIVTSCPPPRRVYEHRAHTKAGESIHTPTHAIRCHLHFQKHGQGRCGGELCRFVAFVLGLEALYATRSDTHEYNTPTNARKHTNRGEYGRAEHQHMSRHTQEQPQRYSRTA